jgi:plastocyanin
VLLLCLLALPAFAQTEPARREAPRTNLSGYMDFHFNNEEFTDARLDFHRFVLLVTHSFSPRIRFVGELELEHAFVEGLEEGGELELEQAYVDFLLDRSFNVRAGMMLMPIGIINERHEPPVFYGVERPFIDTVIIPTTWFDVGAGVHGEVGRGWRYRAYVVAPLNAAEFNADIGLRDGRQKGSESNVGRPAVTGRLEYVGVRGLTLGASGWSGRSGFEFRPRFDVPVSLVEADARYSRRGYEFRGQFAQVWIDNAGVLNDTLALRVGVNPNIGSALRGFSLEGSRRFFSGSRLGEVGGFVRYENFDTQYRMPSGYVPLQEFDREAWVVGANYWPDPDVAIKWTINRPESELGDQCAELVQRRVGMVVLMGHSIRLLALAIVIAVVVAEGAGRAQDARVVDIAAERFAFTPSEIRVKAGTRLEIRLQSDDTAHGFHIVGTDVDIELPKRGRGVATVNFQPEAGRYTFECSRVCGAGHEFMRGVIIAE